MFMQYRSTRSAVFSVKYHVIWCPKYRRRVLGSEVVRRYVGNQKLAAARKTKAA